MPAKVSTKSVRLELPLDLYEALASMGQDSKINGVIPAPRNVQNMIQVSLMWAVWRYTHGGGPDVEMLHDDRGYTKWNECLLEERAQIADLEALYRMKTPKGGK